MQAISGTGSIRLGFEFLHRHHSVKTVYISKPTWGEKQAVVIDLYIARLIGWVVILAWLLVLAGWTDSIVLSCRTHGVWDGGTWHECGS